MAELIKQIYVLDFDTKSAQGAVEALISDVSKYQAEVGKAKKGTAEWTAANQRLTEAEAKLNGALRQETNTVNGLRAKQDLLNKAVNSATIGSRAYANASRQLQITQAQLGKVTGQTSKTMAGLGNVLKSAVPFLTATAAAGLLFREIRGGIVILKNFEKGLSELSAITGATGEDLEFFKEQAKAIGVTTTTSAQQALTAFKLIASAKPELLANRDALAEVTKAAVTLSEASGLDLAQSGQVLAETLNQIRLPASESARVINVMAAASKLGAKEIPFVSEALAKFGGVAESAGLSVEQSVAAVELLGESIPQANIVGTNMRGVLIKMQKAAAEGGREFVGLGGELELLAPKVNDITFLTKTFGEENLLAIQTLIKSRSRLDELTKGITGTNAAYEQASIQTDNLDGDLKRLQNAYTGLILEGGGVSEGLRGLVQGLTAVLRNADPVIDAFKFYGEILGDIFAPIGDLVEAFGSFNEVQEEGAKKTSTVAKVMEAVGFAMKFLMIPLKIFSVIFKFVVDKIFVPAIKTTGEIINKFGALKTAFNAVGNAAKGAAKLLGLYKDKNEEVTKDAVSAERARSKAREEGRKAIQDELKALEAKKKAEDAEKGKEKAEDELKAIEERRAAVQSLTNVIRDLNIELIKDQELRSLAGLDARLKEEISAINEQQKLFAKGTKGFEAAEQAKVLITKKFAAERLKIITDTTTAILNQEKALVSRLLQANTALIEDELTRQTTEIIAEINKVIEELEKQRASVQEQLAAAASAGDQERIESLTNQIGQINDLIISETVNRLNAVNKLVDDNAQREIDEEKRKQLELLRIRLQSINTELELRRFSHKDKIDLINEEALVQSVLAGKEIDNARLLSATLEKIEQDRIDKIKALNKQRVEDRIAEFEQIKSAGLELANFLVGLALSEVEGRIGRQKENVDRVRELADRGNAELLQAEQEKLDKLNEQRQKFVRQQQALAVVELVANFAVAISKAAAQSGIAAPITIAATLIALVAGLAKARALAGAAIPTFKEGEIDIKGGGTGTSDSIHAKVSRGESVMTALETRRFKPTLQAIRSGRARPDVLNRVSDRYIGYNEFMRDYEPVSSAGVERRLESVENAIRDLPGQISINTHKWMVKGDELVRVIENRIGKADKINRLAR